MNRIEEARHAGMVLTLELFAERTPLGLTKAGVEMLLRRMDVPVPTDVFGFLSKGRMSDRDVTDWTSPSGGVISIQ